MGYVFEVEDVVFWEPSVVAARVVLNQIRLLESIMQVKSGITEPMPDTIDVELLEFRTFFQIVVEHDCWRNDTISLCLAGCRKVLLAFSIHFSLISDENEYDSLSLDFTEATAFAARHFENSA